MGEAKRRGVDGATYGTRRRYETLANERCYIAVNEPMRACAARPAGERQEIDTLAADLAALRSTPSANPKAERPYGPPADEAGVEASTRAISDRLAEAVRTAEIPKVLLVDAERIVDVDPAGFDAGWLRGLGPRGAGRCFRRTGSQSASLNPISGSYLSLGSEASKASIEEAPTFLGDKGVQTPAGVLAMGDPLCLQIATMIRQSVVEHRDPGVARIGDATAGRLRGDAEAVLASMRRRHCDRAASADVIASIHLLEKGADLIPTLGSLPALPFLAVAGRIARLSWDALPADGGPADDLARSLDAPLLRFVARDRGNAGDWAGFDTIAAAFDWDPSDDASAILVEAAERPALRGFAARIDGAQRAINLQDGGLAVAFEREGSRYLAIAGDPSGDANVVAWRA